LFFIIYIKKIEPRIRDSHPDPHLPFPSTKIDGHALLREGDKFPPHPSPSGVALRASLSPAGRGEKERGGFHPSPRWGEGGDEGRLFYTGSLKYSIRTSPTQKC